MLDVDLTAQTFTTGPYDPDHQVAFNGWVQGDEILSPSLSRTGDVTLRALALSTGTFTDWASWAPLPEHPEAVPANAFVIACDQLAACTRENFARDRCITRFSAVQGGTPAQDATYQALMTAAASGCAALKTIDAAIQTVPCSTASYPNRPQCAADQQCVVPASGAPYCAPSAGPWACNTCDTNGNAIKCNGLSPQEVVPCGARGLSCTVVDTVPTCVSGSCSGPTTAGLGTTCVGDRQVGLCANGGAVYARDCERTDSTCQGDHCAGTAVRVATRSGLAWPSALTAMPAPRSR